MAYHNPQPQLKIIAEEDDPVVVKIPFAMKEDFKQAFPATRWNRSATAWNVTKAISGDLRTWISDQQVPSERVLAEYAP